MGGIVVVVEEVAVRVAVRVRLGQVIGSAQIAVQMSLPRRMHASSVVQQRTVVAAVVVVAVMTEMIAEAVAVMTEMIVESVAVMTETMTVVAEEEEGSYGWA